MAYRGAHRNNDLRVCTAKTTVLNQSTVFVNDELWAVLNTTCNHGDGQLINTTGDTVFVEGKPVIVHGPDHAKPNDLRVAQHSDPMTAEGSPNVFAYGGER